MYQSSFLCFTYGLFVFYRCFFLAAFLKRGGSNVEGTWQEQQASATLLEQTALSSFSAQSQ